MPALIFISGYLFGHTWQRTTAQPFKTFVFKKFKRLIIPSIIFSFFYFLLFKDTTLPTSKVSYAIVNGCGHLWFLPMLFWSFICCYLLHKSKIDNKIIIALLAILSILPIPTLPLRLSSTCTYLVFFYLGSIMQISGGGGKSLNNKAIALIILDASYFFLQFGLLMVQDFEFSSLIQKVLYLLTVNAAKLLLGLSGIGIAFIATQMFLSKNSIIAESIIILSTYCYGIYIIHQFILMLFYYNTPLADIINPFVLPWIAFIATLLLSVFITAITLRTKIGRFLIG